MKYQRKAETYFDLMALLKLHGEWRIMFLHTGFAYIDTLKPGKRQIRKESRPGHDSAPAVVLLTSIELSAKRSAQSNNEEGKNTMY